MKKIIFCIVAFSLLLVAGTAWSYYQQQHKMSDLVLANIEALARNEDGVSVGVCFMKVGMNGVYVRRQFCDSRTTATMIYPCKGETSDFYDKDKKDRCTK